MAHFIFNILIGHSTWLWAWDGGFPPVPNKYDEKKKKKKKKKRKKKEKRERHANDRLETIANTKENRYYNTSELLFVVQTGIFVGE